MMGFNEDIKKAPLFDQGSSGVTPIRVIGDFTCKAKAARLYDPANLLVIPAK